MQSRDKIAYLAALSLFMSSLELLIPRPLPFFRLGLANVPVLMALGLDFHSFLLLLVMKGIGTGYVSGSLFSIFSVISLSQSLVSGIVMYALKKAGGKHVSLYGLSSVGALSSTFVQLFLASLYIGGGTMVFLPVMLLISFPSSVLTAFIAARMKLPEEIRIPEAEGENNRSWPAVVAMLVSGFSIMMLKSLPLLALALILAFIFQHLAGRRIKLMPHIILLIFMLLSSLVTPSGRVLFTVLSFPVTEGALLSGLSKSLQLSGAIAVSQGFSGIIVPGRGIIGRTVSIFTVLLSSFRNTEGSLRERIRETLMMECSIKRTETHINVPVFTIIFISLSLIILLAADCIIF